MTFTIGNFLLLGSVLLFVSIFASKTGFRFGVPALLLFLLTGMIFGSDGIGVHFSDFQQMQFIGVMALGVILFSGGADTKISDIRPVVAEGIILSTLGVVLTALITGLFIFAIAPLFMPKTILLSLSGCFLLATVMSSTDSASVFSILRSKNLYLSQNARPLLELESGSNDPMAYMLMIMLLNIIKLSSLSIGVMLWMLVIQFALGLIFGYILGRIAVFIMNHINLDYSALYSILLLAFVFFIFSFTSLMKGNGFLAVYIAGLVVGNCKMMYKKSIITFFDGLAWLFQIIMFLAMGLLVNPSELLGVAPIATVIGIFMIVAARPIAVFLCLKPFKDISTNVKWFVSWVGLRGAVPIIFATYPYVAGVPGAKEIFNIVFFITIISLIVQGSTVPYAAKVLGILGEPTPHKDFSVELPEDIAVTSELIVTPKVLDFGSKIKEFPWPPETLVMMLKREDSFFIPNPETEVIEGDKLLLISAKEEEMQEVYKNFGIDNYLIYKN
ncbi:MAG: potassium/proton antiporter [Elusimicrobiota bacterium]|jgi:cell volume regulation protein A|nr:potassium/proton antiporter [Elusimicrobiota bacterium]